MTMLFDTNINLRPEVLAFAVMMEQRLREKDADKGQSWKEMALFGLSTAALAKASFVQTDITKNHCVAAAKHVVDIANYCMMIADVAGALDAVAAEGADGNAGPGWPALDQVQMS